MHAHQAGRRIGTDVLAAGERERWAWAGCVVRDVSPQGRTCVAGQTCLLDRLEGTHLDPADALWVLDTCGKGGIVPGFPGGVSLSVASNATAGGASASWGAEPVSAAGGVYRLCWCAGLVASCTATGEFRVDAGALLVVGPNPSIQDALPSAAPRSHCSPCSGPGRGPVRPSWDFASPATWGPVPVFSSLFARPAR